MSKISDDISKDLKDQPKFTSDIGDKAQDHHTFDIGEQTFLKKLQHFLHGNPTIVPVIILILSVIAFGFIAGGKFFSAEKNFPPAINPNAITLKIKIITGTIVGLPCRKC